MMSNPQNRFFSSLSRSMSLRVKSYIVYGALIIGATAVAIFVFYQKQYLHEQFDELQAAYEAESQLREMDLSILHTIQTQVVALENVDIEYGSPHARKHLKLLLDFHNTVIIQHLSGGPEVTSLGKMLEAAHETPSRKNMANLGKVLKDFRSKLEQNLASSQEHRNMLAQSVHDGSDHVAMIALALGFLGFIILGVINALFFTHLTNDLQLLKKRAHEIASGNRTERIVVNRYDEVGELIESINQMAGELDEHDKIIELERQKYFHQEEMAAIGMLAAGIAHEVGNPIAAITAVVDELRQSCDGREHDTTDKDNILKLDMLLEQAERLKTITREVSEFARPQLNERELLDLNELIRSTCNLMRYDSRWKAIDLKLELDVSLPALYGVPSRLTQVIMNLLINAADSFEGIDDREPVVIVSTTLDEDENSIYMVVQDNGRGMNNSTLRHALDVFYTTKEAGKGTGLGMSLCHSIITEHEGRIYVVSTQNVGTAVRIYLPLINEENLEENNA